MELKEFQKKADEVINSIDEKVGVKHDVNSSFIHLIEELGEVAREFNKPNVRGEEINKEELGKELFDVMVFIAKIANLSGIDLEEAIDNKLKELNKKYDLNL